MTDKNVPVVQTHEVKGDPYKVISLLGERMDAVFIGDGTHMNTATSSFLYSKDMLRALAESGKSDIGLELPIGDNLELLLQNRSYKDQYRDDFVKTNVDFRGESYRVPATNHIDNILNFADRASQFAIKPHFMDDYDTGVLENYSVENKELILDAIQFFEEKHNIKRPKEEESYEDRKFISGIVVEILKASIPEETRQKLESDFLNARTLDIHSAENLRREAGREGVAVIYGAGHDNLPGLIGENTLIYDVFPSAADRTKQYSYDIVSETSQHKGEPHVIYFAEENRLVLTEKAEPWMIKVLEENGMTATPISPQAQNESVYDVASMSPMVATPKM